MIEKVKQAYQRLGAEKAVDLMRTEMGKKGRERKKERELEREISKDYSLLGGLTCEVT